MPGPLSNVLSCLLPVEGLPRAGHVPGMDSCVSSLSYTPTPESNVAKQAASAQMPPPSTLLLFHPILGPGTNNL